jgi:hypothetical protein
MSNEISSPIGTLLIGLMIGFYGVTKLHDLYIINSLPLLAGQRRKLIGRRYPFWFEAIISAVCAMSGSTAIVTAIVTAIGWHSS